MQRRWMVGMALAAALAVGSGPSAPGADAPDSARTEPGMQVLEQGWQVLSLAYSRSGRWLASGCADRTARVWDARNGKLEWELPKEC